MKCRVLSFSVFAAATLAFGWTTGDKGYWPEWADVDRTGKLHPSGETVTIRDDGSISPAPGSFDDAAIDNALAAMQVALQASVAIRELQIRVDTTISSLNDNVAELATGLDEYKNALAAHLNSVGDEDSLTNLLADVAWSGKYEELIHIPTLHCEESEEYPGWKCLWLYYLAGTAGDSEAVSYGDPIWMPNLAFSGKDTDIIYESAPYSSMVQKSGDKYYNYVVSVNAQTHQLEYTQGAEVVFSCKCNNGEGCQCGGSGGSGGNCTCESSGKTCNCSIKTADDVHAAEIDPTFTDWRDGTFAPWKEWVDDGINNTARHVGAIETYLGYSPMSPKLPGNPPGL